MNKVYEIITERIIKRLEQGEIPWKAPWAGGGLPCNGISHKPYTGINPFLLAGIGYMNPNWLTFQQAKELGGSVMSGEKSAQIVFWKILDSAPDPNRLPGEISSKDLDRSWMLRYYNVFNVEQCEGLPDKFQIPKREHKPIPEAESILAGYKGAPVLQHKAQKCYYVPGTDIINMAAKESFDSAEMYYKVLFHELIHSTGHEKRLDRKLKGHTENTRTDYSKEELIAELGSAFLSNHAGIYGIPQEDESAAYIQSWIKALKNDVRMIVQAGSGAQKAADYILSAAL